MRSEESYAEARALHELRTRAGWRALGRKIGFTNRGIWTRYGVHEPIWGMVYDRTLIRAADNFATVPLAELAQPRIEPEICFRLRAAPRSGAEADLVAAIEWMAHAVEIVQCDLPGWKTNLAHSIASNALHGRLVVGSPLALGEARDLLSTFELVLRKNGTEIERGRGDVVLGSPLAALSYLVELLARQPEAPPLEAGEIVSTGTLTDAHPVAAGETWSTDIRGLPLPGLTVRFS